MGSWNYASPEFGAMVLTVNEDGTWTMGTAEMPEMDHGTWTLNEDNTITIDNAEFTDYTVRYDAENDRMVAIDADGHDLDTLVVTR